MQYVIGIGEALFDCLPTGRKLGGAPANFAFHASQFGLNSCAVSAIGNDELGREIIDILTRAGLRYQLPRVAFPFILPRITFLYFTLFGNNMIICLPSVFYRVFRVFPASLYAPLLQNHAEPRPYRSKP